MAVKPYSARLVEAIPLQYATSLNHPAVEVPQTDFIQCLTDLCNELSFINSNTQAYIGYTAWSAGGFSPLDYNLTLTPKGSAGNFTDQELASRCVIGTRLGSNGTATNTTKTAGSPQNPQPESSRPQVVFAAGAHNIIEGGWIGSILAVAALAML